MLYPSEETYSNSPPIKAMPVNGEKQEYSPSLYFHLVANLGNKCLNIGSFSCSIPSHCIASIEVDEEKFLIMSEDMACILPVICKPPPVTKTTAVSNKLRPKVCSSPLSSSNVPDKNIVSPAFQTVGAGANVIVIRPFHPSMAVPS